MTSIINTIIGRKSIAPLMLNDEKKFIRFLEQNAERIDNRSRFQIPLFSRKKGFVFFEENGAVMIRYNSEGSISFTSLCFFSGKITPCNGSKKLVGCYRFPWFMELPKYLVLALSIIWIVYFASLILLQSPLPLVDWIVGILGLGFFALAGAFFGNVSASLLARNLIKNVNGLLAQHFTQP